MCRESSRVRSPTVREGKTDFHPPMTKQDYIDFQTRTQPIAYLITFRCYGTWLHGAVQGSIDRKHYNRFGTPDMPPNRKILDDKRRELKNRAVRLNKRQGEAVEIAIGEVCACRKYALYRQHPHESRSRCCRHFVQTRVCYEQLQILRSTKAARDESNLWRRKTMDTSRLDRRAGFRSN